MFKISIVPSRADNGRCVQPWSGKPISENIRDKTVISCASLAANGTRKRWRGHAWFEH